MPRWKVASPKVLSCSNPDGMERYSHFPAGCALWADGGGVAIARHGTFEDQSADSAARGASPCSRAPALPEPDCRWASAAGRLRETNSGGWVPLERMNGLRAPAIAGVS